MSQIITEGNIVVIDNEVRIQNLVIAKKDIVDYLRSVPEDAQEDALIRAIEVGVYSLQRAMAGQDMEFVKRQVESLLNDVTKAVGTIPNTVGEKLAGQIGADNGQLLYPIKMLIDKVSEVNSQKLSDVKNLLDSEIDPNKTTSTIGRVLCELRNLLDPRLDGSVQKSFDETIQQVASQDGALAISVRKVVEDSVKPLKEELDSLAKEVKGKNEAQKIIDRSTLKGLPYEEEILEQLQRWAQSIGANVEHVGKDNQTGDILINIPPSSVANMNFSIIVEVKTEVDGKGKTRITNILKDAMSIRNANSSIFLSREREGLAKEIGDWAEGDLDLGHWIATTPEHLITAVRFLMARRKIEELQRHESRFDANLASEQVSRIRTTLTKITNINTKVSEITSSASAIGNETKSLKQEIEDSLRKIEQAITSLPEELQQA